MSVIKFYINGVEKSIPYNSVKITKNISTYFPVATIEIPNPNGIFNNYFSINLPFRIDLYDKTTTSWIKKIEGYVSNIKKSITDQKISIEISQHTGRMQQKTINEVYDYYLAYDIVNSIADKYLPEFTKTNIDYDGTDTLSIDQSSSDNTITLNTNYQKYAQKFNPTEENIVKINIYCSDCTNAIADIELRSNNTTIPSDYDILKSVRNVNLSDGENTIYLTRSNLDTSLDYWIIITWKGGSFKLATNGSSNTGRVAYSSTSTESWATIAKSDLKYQTYWTTAKIVEKFKAALKTISDTLKDLALLFPDDWIYYIDDDADIHWELEEFVSSVMTFDDTNIFNITNEIEGRKIYNNIIVNGGSETTTNYTDSFLGNGTQKTYSFSPGNPVKPLKKVTVNGVVKIEDTDFTVDYINKTINFNSAPANGHVIAIIHDFTIPVSAVSQDSSSIATYGQIDYVKSDKNIVSKQRAKEIADGLKSLYSNEMSQIQVQSFLFPFLSSAQYVTINKDDINDDYLISQIEFDISLKGITTKLTLTTQEVISIPDVLRELKAQIHEVQMAQYDLESPITELVEFTGAVDFTAEITIDEEYICDSFVLDHTTDNGKLERGEILDLFTDVSNFTSSEFTLAENTDTDYYQTGTKSLKVTSGSTQTGYLTSTYSYGDLSTYTGANSGSVSEGVVGIWVWVDDETDINSISLKIGSSASDYIEKTGEFIGFRNNGWNYIVFKLADGTTTGTPDWTSVDYIQITMNLDTNDYYLDYLTIGDGNSIALNGLGSRVIRRTIV